MSCTPTWHTFTKGVWRSVSRGYKLCEQRQNIGTYRHRSVSVHHQSPNAWNLSDRNYCKLKRPSINTRSSISLSVLSWYGCCVVPISYCRSLVFMHSVFDRIRYVPWLRLTRDRIGYPVWRTPLRDPGELREVRSWDLEIHRRLAVSLTGCF